MSLTWSTELVPGQVLELVLSPKTKRKEKARKLARCILTEAAHSCTYRSPGRPRYPELSVLRSVGKDRGNGLASMGEDSLQQRLSLRNALCLKTFFI